MFLTSQQAQIDELGIFAPNFSVWAYVEHKLQRPWFYVATTTIEAGDTCGDFSMIMACSEPMLGSIMSFHGVTIHVESVLLVSPGHINHSEHWQMEPLERLERYSTAKASVFIYHLLNGRKYFYGDEGVLRALVLDIDTIFSKSMIGE